MKKELLAFLNPFVLGANAIMLLYLVATNWPHSNGYMIALIWFGVFVVNNFVSNKLLNSYSDLTKDMLKTMRDMAGEIQKDIEREANKIA